MRKFSLPISLSLLLALFDPAVAQPAPMESRPPSFPQVRIYQLAPPDAGLLLQSITVNGKSYPADQLAQATQAALASAGWLKAQTRAREKLALEWFLQVLQGDAQVLSKAPKDFNGKFQPPTATTRPDGSIQVRAWQQEPVGMMARRGNFYRQANWIFDKTGKPTAQRVP